MAEASTALITGTSSGIGLATARLMLDRGYRVVGLCRRAGEAGIAHPLYIPAAVDLTDTRNLDEATGRLARQFDFDCLIHAAGAGHFGSIEQFSVTQIEASMRLNLTSAMLLCRALVPGMRRRRRGCIVLLGSESALAAGRKGALYSAAKFGLRGFSRALREDCASDGIRVSLINPGMVRSPFFDQLPFAPGAEAENAITVDDVAGIIWQVLQSNPDIVLDEINLSPRVKSIEFSRRT